MGDRSTWSEEVMDGQLEWSERKGVDVTPRKGWALDDHPDACQQQLVDWQKFSSGGTYGRPGFCPIAWPRSPI